jgi:putative acetyltransferase
MRTDEIVVRVMQRDEFPAMRDLSEAAFGGDHTIRLLLDELHMSWAWDDDLSFVATRNDEIVGQVLYTHAFLDAPERLIDVLLLSPVGVRPDLQGIGIGDRLIRESLREVEYRREPLVFLEGHPGYYPRFGFRPGAELGFTAPSARIPRDAFMALPLSTYEPWMRGGVVYPDAFWRVDAVGLRD